MHVIRTSLPPTRRMEGAEVAHRYYKRLAVASNDV
jgi:hypothetical protein